MTSTGVGALLGVPVAAAGTVVAGSGVVTVVDSVSNIGINITGRLEMAGGGGGKLKPGDKTPNGYELTIHSADHANERGFSLKKIDDIINGYSQKFYSYGEEIYCKKNGNYYDVVIKSRTSNNIVSVIGGNTNSLKTTKDIEKFFKNSGNVISTIPLN